MTTLKHIPFPRSLNRPLLLLGGERKPVIISALLCLLLFLSDISILKFGLALGLWTIVMAILRLMAKRDPLLLHVYFRRLKYRAYYPAQSRAIR